jgi:multiple sugar transport system ATP-binding protein
VYRDPADTFVATFLGSPPMNLIERDDGLVGFRPERFLPADGDPGDDGILLSFAIQRVEHLGSERHIVGTVANLGEDTRVIAVLPSTITVPVSPGETRDFAIDGADLRFFAKSGERRERARL